MGKRLENKVAVISGGCGGAGTEICRLFAKEGAAVIIADINEKIGNELQTEINMGGNKALFVKTDVTKEKQVADCIKLAVETYGKLDILVNIACIMMVDSGYFCDVTEEMFDLDIDINLKGSFFFSKYAIPQLLKSDCPSIVSFSSIGASRGVLGHTIYSAAKAGIESMTRSIAAQYGKQGIRANCIRPGVMMNPVFLSNPQGREYGDAILSHLPMKEIGMGADAAPVALFLASQESKYINGEIITMDGGLTCHEPQWKEDMDPANKDALR